jgi:hypothetical protein
MEIFFDPIKLNIWPGYPVEFSNLKITKHLCDFWLNASLHPTSGAEQPTSENYSLFEIVTLFFM